MTTKLSVAAVLLAALAMSGCSEATYYVMKKDTYTIGMPMDKQPKAVKLQVLTANAPGGEAFVGVLYIDSTHVQLKGNGDSSALVQATAAVGRLAVQAAKAFVGGH